MTTRVYTLPVEQTRWHTPSNGTVTFTWDYDEGRDRMLALYEKGKRKQWNASDRIDWSHEPDPMNPLGFPDNFIPLWGSDIWEKLDEKGRGEVRLHHAAWQFSQFMHGEQGALICAAKIVGAVPDLDSKYYAATQTMDEARHVETYSRFLFEKLGLAYPINPHLRTLLDQVLADSRWDMTYLGMQILIEGLALAAFGGIRDHATDPLARAVNAFVMEDEARHVAFGRIALREYYPQLTEKERDEREEFSVEACHLMRDRFLAEELWDHLGLGAANCVAYVDSSETFQVFRRLLFSRIVPSLKDVGLWGPRIRKAFADMGVMDFAEIDLQEMGVRDEQAALMLEREARRASGA